MHSLAYQYWKATNKPWSPVPKQNDVVYEYSKAVVKLKWFRQHVGTTLSDRIDLGIGGSNEYELPELVSLGLNNGSLIEEMKTQFVQPMKAKGFGVLFSPDNRKISLTFLDDAISEEILRNLKIKD